MGSLLSRSVEIEISNNTQNIILKEPRTYFSQGHCYNAHLPVLSSQSMDICRFSGDPKLWGLAGTTSVRGVLVYEAESFTLAIYCYNPIDYSQFSVDLGLELSPGKAHLDNLRATYDRMANGTYSSSDQDIKFTRVNVAGSHGTARLSHGPIKVTATMSNNMSSRIRVVLEEQRRYGEEGWGGNSWNVRGDRFRRNEETGSRDSRKDSYQDLR